MNLERGFPSTNSLTSTLSSIAAPTIFGVFTPELLSVQRGVVLPVHPRLRRHAELHLRRPDVKQRPLDRPYVREVLEDEVHLTVTLYGNQLCRRVDLAQRPGLIAVDLEPRLFGESLDHVARLRHDDALLEPEQVLGLEELAGGSTFCCIRLTFESASSFTTESPTLPA